MALLTDDPVVAATDPVFLAELDAGIDVVPPPTVAVAPEAPQAARSELPMTPPRPTSSP
jgi:hypothetical protein